MCTVKVNIPKTGSCFPTAMAIDNANEIGRQNASCLQSLFVLYGKIESANIYVWVFVVQFVSILRVKVIWTTR